MKKLFLFVGMALMALTGCNKNGTTPDIPIGKSAQLVLTLKKAMPGTKAETEAGTEAENKINTIDLFVFNSTGDLDAYDQYAYPNDDGEYGDPVGQGYNKPTLDCTTGPGKIIYAIVNGPWAKSELAAGIGNVSALQAKVFELSQNMKSGTPVTLDNFQMIGNTTKDFAPGPNTASVTVSRTVARVRLAKITRNFASSALTGELKVTKVYMSNVVGSYGLDGTTKNAASNIWWNKYAYDNTTPHEPYPGYIAFDTAMNPWLYNDVEDYTIAQGASDSEHAYVFYVMPNQVPYNAADGGTGEWAPRRTKLVVECLYTPEGGTAKTYYYTIPICEQDTYPDITDAESYAGLNANTSYDITDLVLTKLGSTNPDEPVVSATVELTLQVAPWDIYPLETETGKYVI